MQTPATGPAVAGEPILVGSLWQALGVLEDARNKQNLTRSELAALTRGVTDGQLSEYFRGIHEPAPSKLFAIAKTLGMRWALVPMIENEDG